MFVERWSQLASKALRPFKPETSTSQEPTVLIAERSESTKDATTQQLTGMAAELQKKTRVSTVG